MNKLDFYLFLIQEKLEDIKIPKRKWFDFFNSETRMIYRNEIKRVFEKHFIVRHSIIDNKKTTISISKPLIGWNYHVTIQLFDKKGKDIIDYNHEGNSFREPLVVQLQKKGKKWNLYYHTLFIKDKYQGKGLGPQILKSVDLSMRQLQKSKLSWYQSSDIGKYVWSKLPGVIFKNRSGTHSHQDVETKYQNWCQSQNKKCKIGRKPSDYPKEYLLSKYAPEFIDYLVPI
ncbi:MAG: hypothetical protein ACTSX1_09335 [Candidatus Heimdallarchaeaceae archaeon]